MNHLNGMQKEKENVGMYVLFSAIITVFESSSNLHTQRYVSTHAHGRNEDCFQKFDEY